MSDQKSEEELKIVTGGADATPPPAAQGSANGEMTLDEMSAISGGKFYPGPVIVSTGTAQDIYENARDMGNNLKKVFKDVPR